MMRWRIAAVTVLLVGGTVLGAAGCGTATPGGVREPAREAADEAVDVFAALGVEGQALAAMGFDPEDLTVDEMAAGPTSTPSAGPSRKPKADSGDGWRKRNRARVMLRRGTLHGEAVVRTRDGGTKTVVVQRGTVTAIDATSVTVRSTDGFVMTWRFGDRMRVVQRRATVEPDQVKVGTQLGVAGTRDGDRNVARLILIPMSR